MFHHVVQIVLVAETKATAPNKDTAELLSIHLSISSHAYTSQSTPLDTEALVGSLPKQPNIQID